MRAQLGGACSPRVHSGRAVCSRSRTSLQDAEAENWNSRAEGAAASAAHHVMETATLPSKAFAPRSQ